MSPALQLDLTGQFTGFLPCVISRMLASTVGVNRKVNSVWWLDRERNLAILCTAHQGER